MKTYDPFAHQLPGDAYEQDAKASLSLTCWNLPLTSLFSYNGRNKIFLLPFKKHIKTICPLWKCGGFLCWEKCGTLLGRQKRLEYVHGAHASTAIHTNPREPSESKKKKPSVKQMGTGLAASKYCWLLLMLWQAMSKATARHVTGKRHEVDALNNSYKKRRGRKEELGLSPPQRGNMTVFSLRREVVSMLIITKQNLTGFAHLHNRTLPVSLLGLGSLFCSVFQQSIKSSVLP